MRINGSLLPISRDTRQVSACKASKDLHTSTINSPAALLNLSQSRLIKLNSDLTRIYNGFLGYPLKKPLAIETVNEIQSRFWTASDNEKIPFCDLIWKCCEESALELSAKKQKAEIPLSPIPPKSPVIFSTREGLGIDLELVQEGGKLKPSSFSISPAGCHINVARALNNFGTNAELIGISSNSTIGNIFLDLLKKEEVDTSKLFKIQDDTRYFFCTFINGKEYWIVSLPPVIAQDDIDMLTTELNKTCKRQNKEILALANNPPSGAPDSYMAEVITNAKDKHGMFVIYDTKLMAVGRELLEEVLNAGPSFIKPNLDEFAEIVDEDPQKLRQDKDLIAHLAKEILEKYGIEIILISCDKDGAILVDKKRAAYANVPEVKVVCTVGAGDTGIAAIIDRSKKENFSLHKLTDKRFKSILSAFVAGGVATVSKRGTEIGTLEEVTSLEKQIKVNYY